MGESSRRVLNSALPDENLAGRTPVDARIPRQKVRSVRNINVEEQATCCCFNQLIVVVRARILVFVAKQQLLP
jgi:hypothetical protein